MIFLFFLAFTTSCDYVRSTSGPCREDSFFCNDPDQQKVLLKALSDSRLLIVSRINYKRFHPPSQDFSKEIARRGPAGITILQKLSANDRIDMELFRDTARIYRAKYNMDVCRSDGVSMNLKAMCTSLASVVSGIR